ncbi:MAG: hypothetical protein QOD69_412 [Solirubrobacteraceae bacterium]|nr:hypothetical protein [Solirubrobacteraceae bacterium]
MLSKTTQHRTARRGSLVALAAAGALLAGGASSALASEITVGAGPAAGDYVYTAALGLDSALAITQTGPDTLTFDDTGDVITAVPAGCTVDPDITTTFNCTGANVTSITVNLRDNSAVDIAESSLVDALAGTTVVQNGGDGNDTLTAALTATSVANTLNGGLGDDVLNGGTGADTLSGGDGSDQLNGGDGNDTLNGDAGNDVMFDSAGADDVHGGGSNPIDLSDPLGSGVGDILDYTASTTAAVSVTLDGVANDGVAGENDNVHNDVETVFTGDGADSLTGGTGTNVLSSGAGNDTIDARDGVTDLVSCGADNDTALVDASDIVIDDPANSDVCESVQIASPPVTDPPVTNPPANNPPANNPPANNPPATNPIVAPIVVPVAPSSKPQLPAPKSLSAKLTAIRDRSKPYRFTIKGKLGLPESVTKAKGCSGSVTLTAKRGKKTVGSKKVLLKKDCSYTATATVTGKGKFKITAKFGGNGALGAKSSATLNARAG